LETLQDKNILLADDDPMNIFALTAALEDFGVNITTVTTGTEAVDAVMNNNDFDIVLMDIMMPEMDGYEAMRIIRSKGFNNLPIIALTAKAMRGDVEKCLEAGASDYMSKPIDVATLVEMMLKWMNK
jgi:CheY-like chemotaxis protein